MQCLARCSPTWLPSPWQRPQSRGSPPGGRQPQSYPWQLGRLHVHSAVTQCWACRWAGAAAGLNSPGPAASWPGSAVGAQALVEKGSSYASHYGCRVSSLPLDAAQLSSWAATGQADGRVGKGAGGREPGPWSPGPGRAPSRAVQGRERHRPGRRLGPPAAISSASGQASSANERTGERVRAAGGSAAGGPAPAVWHHTSPAGPVPLRTRRSGGPTRAPLGRCSGWVGQAPSGPNCTAHPAALP